MHRASRSSFAWLPVVALAALTVPAACSSSSVPSVPDAFSDRAVPFCVAGSQASCTCPGGGLGTEMCDESGEGYERCVCLAHDAGKPADATLPVDAGSDAHTAETGSESGLDAHAAEAAVDSGSHDASVDGDAHDAAPLDARLPLDAFATSAFTPSNVAFSAGNAAHAPSVHVTAADHNCNIDSHTLTCDGATPPLVWSESLLSNGSNATVFWFQDLIVDAGTSLQIVDANVVVLVVLGAVDIEGEIDVSGDVDGAMAGALGTLATGVGIGENAAGTETSAGGGGGFCGAGGAGAPNGVGLGGQTYGTPSLVPLVGGSGGGGQAISSITPDGAPLSAPGGGLQITSFTSIVVGASGGINANGGPGGSNQYALGGGGGSGGAILLEAPTVTIQGVLSANGGSAGDGQNIGAFDVFPSVAAAPGADGIGGDGSFGTSPAGAPGASGPVVQSVPNFGGGGGGSGRIRLNTASGSASVSLGIISPSTASACFSEGTLAP
jgi:hypothetical protein